MNRNLRRRRLTVLSVVVGLVCAQGCGPSGAKTYPVSGKLVSPGGDVQKLAGHHIEAALDDDPTVRASGVIGPDGAFTLKTLQEGTIRQGAREGAYRVRIVPAQDDDRVKAGKPPVASKHLKFETSGLTFQVPTSGNLTLEVSSR